MPFAKVAGRALNYEWIEAGRRERPVLVFLHEGLGSIGQWREFPRRLAEASRCPALLYDRYGHGRSEVLQEPKRSIRYMHDEALGALPELLAHLAIDDPVMVGHSDGASIALIHAGAGHPVRAVVAMAPHVFAEPICFASVRNSVRLFETADFAQKLARYHADARRTFYGWANAWLHPQFCGWNIEDSLPGVRCPVLAIQGCEDDSGSMAQVESVARRVGGPCELLKLQGCGHAPFHEQPERTLEATAGFINRVLS
jgi:pimeloyl-ACP methyl ester carboxylesterase